MERTRRDDRNYLFGLIAGVAITIGSFSFVCWILDIKWQPIPNASQVQDGPRQCPPKNVPTNRPIRNVVSVASSGW